MNGDHETDDDLLAMLGPPGRCNGTALRKATRRLSQLYDDVIEPCGLRSTQRSILVHIARAGTPSISELAASLVLDRGALTHTLRPLERDGYVSVQNYPKDRRTRLVSLTPAGRDKLAESTRLWTDAQRRFETSYGAEAAAALRNCLDIIASDDFVQAFRKI